MPSNEDLYRQMEDEEARMDEMARRARLDRITTVPPPRRLPDAVKSTKEAEKLRRYITACKRVDAGLPPTNNPLVNAYHALKGTFKKRDGEIVDPSEEFRVFGISEQEAREAIIKDPLKFVDLAKAPAKRESLGINGAHVGDDSESLKAAVELAKKRRGK